MNFAYLIEPPFNYKTADGQVTGCDVEFARTVLSRLDRGSIRFHETEFAELLPGLASGRWQMTTGLFATEERQRLALFSRPIWALPDGLLVQDRASSAISGYKTIAANRGIRLAVIRDQVQHGTALHLGVPEAQITVFETYVAAAEAVARREVDAFASVARAHAGYLARSGVPTLATITVPTAEKAPAFGAFAFSTTDDELRRAVDRELDRYLGTAEHRKVMQGFGFSDPEIDLIA